MLSRIISPAGLGFRPEGEIPRRHSSNSCVYQGKYLRMKYTVSMPEKLTNQTKVWFRSKEDRGGGFSVLTAREMKRDLKNERGGRGRGRKETVADKPPAFASERSA